MGLARLSFVMAAFLFSGAMLADAPAGTDREKADFWQNPIIKGFGGVHVWPQALKPALSSIKAVFDVDKENPSPAGIHPSLISAGMTINTLATLGVKPNRQKIVLVLRSHALTSALNNSVYESKHHVANANIAAIQELVRAGVTVLACGNALALSGYTPSDLIPEVKIVPSAMVAFIDLQRQGYSIVNP